MSTELKFEVTVHLDFDDGQWDPSKRREDVIKKNVLNIADTIETAVTHEYGVPYVTVSARFTGQKED